MILRLFSLVLACFASTALSAPKMQDIADLQEQVRHFVAATTPTQPGVRTNISVHGVDPRLRLQACKQPLALRTYSKSRDNSRFSINVSCPDSSNWSIYVPVSIDRFANVLISKSHIRKGNTVSADTLAWSERQLNTLTSGYFIQAQDVVGMFARRNIRSGTVIAPKHLRPPYAVHKGESVTIRAIIGGVEVKMNGKAMSNGAKGDIINVTNRSSKRTVEAQVIRPGVVQVRL
jgi:flagella basal body P-ring formation protein FlgA